jgi:vitamin B12 transporter
MRNGILSGVMFASIALTAVARAEEPNTLAPGTVAPDTVVISATRTERPIERLGSSVTVLSAEQIEQSAKRSVISLFDQVPGVYTTEAGGFGGSTTVRLRGADTDQTLVLLDGVRVNDPGSAAGDFDFSTLLLTDIERIEIVRGPQSALWGSDAIGGVVNILSRDGEGPLAARASVEAGSFDTVRAGVGVSAGDDRVNYSVSGSYLYTDGFSRVDENLGASEKDGTRTYTITGKAGARVNDHYRVTFAGSFAGATAETDPSLSSVNGDGDAESKRRVYSGVVSNLFDVLEGRFQNRVSAFLLSSDRDVFDSRSAALRYTRISGKSYGGEYQGTLDLAHSATLTVGARAQIDTGDGAATRSSGLRVPQYDAQFDTCSAYSQIELEALRNLDITVGGRVDDFENGGSRGTYRVTGSWLLGATGTRIRGSYGTGAKAPTIYQTFFSGPDPAVGGTLSGNRDLEVETSRGFDIGVEQTLLNGKLRMGVTYFDQSIENLIQYTNVVFGVSSTYVNLGKVYIDGVESFVTIRPTGWMTIDINYTRTDAHEAGATSPLARTPRDTGSMGIDLHPSHRWSLGAHAVYVGKQFNRTLRRDPLDDFVRVDLITHFALTDRIELFGRIENLLDEQYQVILNAGTPDRSAYAGVRWKF